MNKIITEESVNFDSIYLKYVQMDVDLVGDVFHIVASALSVLVHVVLGGHLVALHLNTPAAATGYLLSYKQCCGSRSKSGLFWCV
jgi:hypothetical protein